MRCEFVNHDGNDFRMMRMMGRWWFSVSALMGWQGIPLRLAWLAASPLRFAKEEGKHEEGNHEGCPYGVFPLGEVRWVFLGHGWEVLCYSER